MPKKKPDPAIYLMAAEELGVSPARQAWGAVSPMWLLTS